MPLLPTVISVNTEIVLLLACRRHPGSLQLGLSILVFLKFLGRLASGDLRPDPNMLRPQQSVPGMWLYVNEVLCFLYFPILLVCESYSSFMSQWNEQLFQRSQERGSMFSLSLSLVSLMFSSVYQALIFIQLQNICYVLDTVSLMG